MFNIFEWMEQTPMRLYYFYINHSVHVAKACLIFITFTFREQTTSNINVICQENLNLLNSSILKIVHCFAIHLPEKPSASHDLNIITSYDSHAQRLDIKRLYKMREYHCSCHCIVAELYWSEVLLTRIFYDLVMLQLRWAYRQGQEHIMYMKNNWVNSIHILYIYRMSVGFPLFRF